MTLLLKDPTAVLDYSIDWGTQYLGGDAIADSSWEVQPDEAGGVTIAGSQFDLTHSTVQAGGGIPGRIYRLVNRVVLASGQTDRRSITLRVEVR